MSVDSMKTTIETLRDMQKQAYSCAADREGQILEQAADIVEREYNDC